jgi:hypothetical protein
MMNCPLEALHSGFYIPDEVGLEDLSTYGSSNLPNYSRTTNGSWMIDQDHDFYYRLLYGRVDRKKERDALFPRKYLRLTVWNIF